MSTQTRTNMLRVVQPVTHSLWIAGLVVAVCGCQAGRDEPAADPSPHDEVGRTNTAPPSLDGSGSTDTPPLSIAEQVAEVRTHFTLDGKPIHPKILHEFEGWMSDGGPITLSLDLTAATGSDEYWDGWAEGTKWVEDPEDQDRKVRDTFIYRFVGRLDDDTLAYVASLNTGGTGWFGSVGFVTAEPQRYADDQWRIVLTTHGTFVAARALARKAIVEGNQLLLGPVPLSPTNPRASVGAASAKAFRPWE